MSTNKLLQSLSEDPQLEKQIGCMAGILQLFDRHQVLTGRRLYGHKRITASASKQQTPIASHCGSPSSDSCGTNDNALRNSSEDQRPKLLSATGTAVPAEHQKGQPPQTPTTPTEPSFSFVFARTPLMSTNEEPPAADVHTIDHLPKVSFEVARSSLLAPRRLDSSRSLHEARPNVAHESKVHARKSVDTAERAAAAARGALKELSRISTDFNRPSHDEDQLSIRDIVASSLSQRHQIPRPLPNVSLSGSNAGAHIAHPQRSANETGTFFTRASGSKDVTRPHTVEYRSSSECVSSQISRTSNGQGNGSVDAPKPPRHRSPRVETTSKTCTDASESLRLLAKFRETSATFNTSFGSEVVEDTSRNKFSANVHHRSQPARSSVASTIRNGSESSSRPFLPRVTSDRVPSRMSSYEPSSELPIDSLLQGGSKAREFPRLSLDSRSTGSKIKADREESSQGKLISRALLSSRSVSCSNSDYDTESVQEKRTSFSYSVVAKLMGLDEMPNEGLAHARSKLGLSRSSEQDVSQTVIHDMNPTFSECGNFVSASFLPTKQWDDMRFFDSEEEQEYEEDEYSGDDADEEDGSLHLGPVIQQAKGAMKVRLGSLKLRPGDRLATNECDNHLAHLCYQPKNHHLMEDRPPHVLSPAARLCAQIEEMQRGDFLLKDFDRGATRTRGSMQGPKPEEEVLKQFLGTIHLRKDNVKSSVEKHSYQQLPATPLSENERTVFLHDQAEQPLPASWKTKRLLNNEGGSLIVSHNNRGRKPPAGSHTMTTNLGMHKQPSHHQMPKQNMSPEFYSQSSCARSDTHVSSISIDSFMKTRPRKATMKTSPVGNTNSQTNHAVVAQRTPFHPRDSLNVSSSKVLALSLPNTPSLPQRASCNGNSSWEASSVSSSSSYNVSDNNMLENSSNRMADRQIEKAEKRRTGILKDKQENKANLVSANKRSLKTLAEKKVKPEGVHMPDSRRGWKPAEALHAANTRSGSRSPVRSDSRKVVDVNRKLNFSNQPPKQCPPPEPSKGEIEGADVVDKNIVACIKSNERAKISSDQDVMLHKSSISADCQDNGAESNDKVVSSHDNTVLFTPSTQASINLVRPANRVMQSSQLLDAVTNVSAQNQDETLEMIDRNVGEPCSHMNSPKEGLRQLQALQQHENEDTESQEEKSTGSCEQPSPVSVLEGPFYEDDSLCSPAANKFAIKLEELEDEAREEQIAEGLTEHNSAPFMLSNGTSQHANLTDREYVKHLLESSCLQGQLHCMNAHEASDLWKLQPLKSWHALELGEKAATDLKSDNCNKDSGTDVLTRKLLFDSVNACLNNKSLTWRLCKHQPWLLSCEYSVQGTITSGWSVALQQGIVGLDEDYNLCFNGGGGKVLMEEVWEDIEASIAKQRGITRIGSQEAGTGSAGEGEDPEGGACDHVGNILENDILSRPSWGGSDAWVTLLVEKGELGLDLERLIFKDLIDHTIRDLGGLLLNSSRSFSAKRQLFKLQT